MLNNIKKIILPKLGFFRDKDFTIDKNINIAIQNSLIFKNHYSLDYKFYFIYLYYRSIFTKNFLLLSHENFINSKKNYAKVYSINKQYINFLKKYSITSNIGSIVTYKNKLIRSLFPKILNIENAIKEILLHKSRVSFLEIGFNLGFMPNYLSKFKKNFFIDYEGIDIVKIDILLKHLKKEYLKNSRQFTFYHAKSDLILKNLIKKNINYDVIHIDGSHDFHDVASDLRLSDKLIRKGGFLIYDDISGDGPARALSEFENKESYEFFDQQQYVGIHPHIILKKVK